MSYAAAIDQLNALAPELHTQKGQQRRKFSLDEVRTLLEALGNPQKRFGSVLIAGTNGKGSTAATLASILTASGVRTGLYTSPHLVRVNERIRVDGAEIADESFAASYFRVHHTAERLLAEGSLPQPPSFFEILTAQAFVYFVEAGVELAVLEVGMGGRLDATNVVDPLISVVTDISLDHMEWLGSTIAAIAREKAGILRRNGTLVTLPQHPEANQVLGETAEALGVRVLNAAIYVPSPGGAAAGAYCVEALGTAVEVNSPLKGDHQKRNIALAIATVVELAENHGLPVTAASIAAGIRSTIWPGRLERIASKGSRWILDVAHNPAGAWALRRGLSEEPERPRTLVFSCLRDKPLKEIAHILFPLFDEIVFAPIHSPRATGPAELMEAAGETGSKATMAESVSEALRLAAERAGNGTTVVTGSVYLVGEARPLLLQGAEQQ